jgi:hypothetical protein
MLTYELNNEILRFFWNQQRLPGYTDINTIKKCIINFGELEARLELYDMVKYDVFTIIDPQYLNYRAKHPKQEEYTDISVELHKKVIEIFEKELKDA